MMMCINRIVQKEKCDHAIYEKLVGNEEQKEKTTTNKRPSGTKKQQSRKKEEEELDIDDDSIPRKTHNTV